MRKCDRNGSEIMPDIKEVMEALEHCIKDSEHIYDNPCFRCPYSCQCEEGYTTALKEDALELLKEQQTIIETYRRADAFLAAHGWRWK